jgi:hypothetical protein
VKVVINRKYGGFGLSDAAHLRLIELGLPVVPMDNCDHGIAICDSEHPESEPSARRLSALTKTRYYASWAREEKHRSHPLVVQVVEELGDAASGWLAKLKIVEVPDGVDFEIDEYDGMETVRERSRSWA